jgi:hypothetical protein
MREQERDEVEERVVIEASVVSKSRVGVVEVGYLSELKFHENEGH